MDYEKMLPEAEWAESLERHYKRRSLKGKGLEIILL